MEEITTAEMDEKTEVFLTGRDIFSLVASVQLLGKLKVTNSEGLTKPAYTAAKKLHSYLKAGRLRTLLDTGWQQTESE